MASDFLSTYTPLANDIAQQTGIDPSVVLGIIDTETGGGAHVKGNNIFGISPSGPQGQYVASYPDVQTAAQAFVQMMQTPRYRGVASAGGPSDQATALVRSGYNIVNPHYASVVANKAASFASQLGYQDQGGGSTATAANAPDYNDTPAANPTPDYNTPSPAKPAATAKPQTETDKALASLPGGGDAAKPPADQQKSGPQSETERALASLPPPKADVTKPPADPTQGYFGPDGSYVPPAAMPTKEQATPPASIPEADMNALTPMPEANPQAVQRIIQAGKEGWQGTPPILTPSARDYVDQMGPLGRYIYNPLLDVGGGILGAGGAILRGGQQFVQEATPDIHLPSLPSGTSIPLGGGRSLSGELTPGSLGRELAALPEAFPTGVPGRVTPPRTAAEARTALGRPVTLEELTAAIRRSDEIAGGDGGTGPSALQPPTTPEAAASPLNPAAAPKSQAQAALEARMTSSAETLRQAQEARGAADDGSQFLGRDWLRSAGDAGGGSYDMGKGGRALSDQARQALGRGDTVQLVTDGGRKTVAITSVDEKGQMRDAQGQPWGSLSIATDGTGREGLRITPNAERNAAANDTAGSQAEAPQPQPAGAAATPREDVADPRTAARAKNLRTSINESALERAGDALHDDNAYVPGIPPRVTAERDFRPDTSLSHKYAYNTDSDYRAAYDRHENARNEGMVDLLRGDAGDELTLDQARAARRQASPSQFGAFTDERPVDASDIAASIQKVLDSPEGKRDAVERTLNNVAAKLYDRDGNLETLPSQLYGVRQHISDLLDKAQRPLDREGTDAMASRFALRALQDQVDNKIQSGAPKYNDYRAAYRELSQPVNQQRFLQQYQQGAKKLTGSDGKLQLVKVNQMLEAIHKGLSDTKFNLAQSLTDDQINNIIAVRNELAARKLLRDQAAVPGSPTVQLLSRTAERGGGTLGTAIRGAAALGGHAAAAYLNMPMLSSAIGAYQAASPILRMAKRQRQVTRAQAAEAAERARLLSVPPANPLIQGGHANPLNPPPP